MTEAKYYENADTCGELLSHVSAYQVPYTELDKVNKFCKTKEKHIVKSLQNAGHQVVSVETNLITKRRYKRIKAKQLARKAKQANRKK